MLTPVGGAERHLIEDFLEFVDDHFDYLNPYDTFGHCKNSRMLMERRCKRILESIAPERVQWQREWSTWYIELTPSYPVKMCGLYPEGSADDVHSIELAMYPGDTMNQARAFCNYLALHGADQFSNLRKSNWTVEPNFHFSFIRRGLGHKVTTLLSLDDYLRYWMPPRTIEQVFPDERGSFRSVLMRFVDAGLMGANDVPEVCNQATNIGANVLNVNPGVRVVYSLTQGEFMAKLKGLSSIVSELRAERTNLVNELKHVDAALSVLGKASGGSPHTKASQPTRVISAASRRKMGQAQKARWARAGKESQPGAAKTTGAAPKRTMSASARRKIAAAQRARWAKIRAKQKKAA